MNYLFIGMISIHLVYSDPWVRPGHLKKKKGLVPLFGMRTDF